MSDDWYEAEAKRATLRRVAAYRLLCRDVRRKGTHSLVYAAYMFGLWHFAYDGRPGMFGLFSILHLGLSSLELVAGALKRFAPSAEGVLADGVVLLAFGITNLLREYLIRQGLVPNAGGGLMLAGFGILWLIQGVGRLRSYAQYRRAFAERPTYDHIRWFDDLLDEIRASDPDTDPDALDLPTRPRAKAKLLGDTAFFLFTGTNEVVIAAREQVVIDRVPSPDPDRLPAGYLVIEDANIGRFPLHPENWRNYARWKAEGREPPVARPMR